MSAPSYRWLFFDIDNTLFDFDQSQLFALEQCFLKADLHYQKEYNTLYTQLNRQCWEAFEAGKLDQQTLKTKRFQILLDALNLQADAKAMGQSYLQQLATTSYLMPYARQLLDYLRPRYHIGAITNGLKIVQRPRIQKAGLTDYFRFIVVSEEIGTAKPSPDFFDVAFDLAGNPPKQEVLVIGDSLGSDIKGGSRMVWTLVG